MNITPRRSPPPPLRSSVEQRRGGPEKLAVEIQDLVREHRGGVRALDGVTLHVEEDAIVGVLGRNGAGKTSLLSQLVGQDFPTSGTVRVFGENPLENDAVLGRTCFMRESQQYPNNFRVPHVLAAGRRFHPGWDGDLADRLAEEFGLPHRRQVAKLSRGMRSMLGIVVALASRAPLTILDEPVLGLDATTRRQFYDLLLKEYADQPRTFVLSTHLIDEAAGLFSSVAVLDRGRVVLEGDADELRGRACVLTGPAAAVDAVTAGLPTLHREQLGGHVAVTIDVAPDPGLRSRVAGLGVEIGPVSLETLVVRAGDGAPTRTGAC